MLLGNACLDETFGIPFGQFRLSSGVSPRWVPRCSDQQPAVQAVKMGSLWDSPLRPASGRRNKREKGWSPARLWRRGRFD